MLHSVFRPPDDHDKAHFHEANTTPYPMMDNSFTFSDEQTMEETKQCQ
ncbi:MAG: hypothetical protein HQL52_15920 [Magnetococcales bacterium]|nr:hypothetical protein [Magnetococcales bacterium]